MNVYFLALNDRRKEYWKLSKEEVKETASKHANRTVKTFKEAVEIILSLNESAGGKYYWTDYYAMLDYRRGVYDWYREFY